jgi:hypothetical protein
MNNSEYLYQNTRTPCKTISAICAHGPCSILHGPCQTDLEAVSELERRLIEGRSAQ